MGTVYTRCGLVTNILQNIFYIQNIITFWSHCFSAQCKQALNVLKQSHYKLQWNSIHLLFGAFFISFTFFYTHKHTHTAKFPRWLHVTSQEQNPSGIMWHQLDKLTQRHIQTDHPHPLLQWAICESPNDLFRDKHHTCIRSLPLSSSHKTHGHAFFSFRHSTFCVCVCSPTRCTP